MEKEWLQQCGVDLTYVVAFIASFSGISVPFH
jgi:hypothetical protein